MALKVGELYALLSLDSKSFFKDINAAEKGTEKLSDSLFAAMGASSAFGAALDKAKGHAADLQSALDSQAKAADKYRASITTCEAALGAAIPKQEELGAQAAEANARYKALNKELESHKSALKMTALTTGENSEQTIGLYLAVEELKEKTKAAKAEATNLNAAYKQQSQEVSSLQAELKDASSGLEAVDADEKKLKARLEEVNAVIKRQGSAWSKLASTAKAAGQWQEQAGRTLTSKVTTPLIGLGTTVAWAGINWESAWAGVEKTVDGTAKQMDDLSGGIRSMAKEIPTGTTALADIAAQAGQLGIETDNILGFTRVIADLGETTNLGGEAATSLARFANITQMNQKDFDRLGSSVVELGNTFATTEAEIVGMAMRLAGAGHQVGMSEADILGFSAALSSVGIEAEAGGSAFSKVMVEMQLAAETGGKKLESFARVAGMTGAQFAQAFQTDAPAAINSFIQGLTTGGESAIKVLDDMGISEVRMRDALLRASGAGDTFARAIASSNRAWKQNNALNAEAQTRYKTTASRLSTLGNQAKDFGISMSDFLLPAVEDGMGLLGGLMGTLDGMSDSSKQAAVNTALFAAALGPGLSIFGKVNKGIGGTVEMLSGLGKSFREAGGGAKGFFKSIGGAIGPAGWVALAAGGIALAASFYDVASGAKAAREATESLIKTGEQWKNTQAKTIFDSGNDPFEQLTLDHSVFAGAVEKSKEDAKELATLDKTIDRLQKKTAKGKEKDEKFELNEDDQKKLNDAVKRRVEINVEYAKGDTNGFDDILRSIEAEKKKLSGLFGEAFNPATDLSASFLGDAVNAANTGILSIMDSLNADYTTQYAEIQKITNEKARQAAQDELDAKYAAERNAAIQKYRETMAAITGMTFGTTEFAETKEQIAGLESVLTTFAKDQSGANAQTLADYVGKLDEGQLASFAAMLAQIKTMKEAGMSDDEITDIVPDASELVTQYETIAGYAAQFKDLEVNGSKPLEGLNTIFTEALPAEIDRIFGDVNAEIKTLTLAPDADLSAIEGLEASVGRLKKGETMTIDSEVNTIEATVNHIKQSVPPEERTTEMNALVNAWDESDAGKISKTVLMSQWTAFVGEYAENAQTVKPEPEIMATLTYDPEQVALVQAQLESALQGTGKKRGFLGIGNSAADELKNYAETLQDPYTELKMADLDYALNNKEVHGLGRTAQYAVKMKVGADPEALSQLEAVDTILQRFQKYKQENPEGFSAMNPDTFTDVGKGFFGEEWTGSFDDLTTQFATMFNTVKENSAEVGANAGAGLGGGLAATDMQPYADTTAQNAETALTNGSAFDEHSPSKRTEPIGNFAAAGVGVGMAKFAFGLYATQTANRLSATLTSAIRSKEGTWRELGLFVGAGVGKGLMSYDFSGITDKLVKQIVAGIESKAGINSPADITQPDGRFLSAGLGVGMRDYDFGRDAARTTSALQAALQYSAQSADLGFHTLLGYGTEDLQRLGKAFDEEASIRVPPSRPSRQPGQAKAPALSIDYDRLADAAARRTVQLSVNGRELANSYVNDASITIKEHDARIKKGYGTR